MRQLDRQYLETPFYGWPRMTAALRRQGYLVSGAFNQLQLVDFAFDQVGDSPCMHTVVVMSKDGSKLVKLLLRVNEEVHIPTQFLEDWVVSSWLIRRMQQCLVAHPRAGG